MGMLHHNNLVVWMQQDSPDDPRSNQLLSALAEFCRSDSTSALTRAT
jgi:hypothetical protein